MECRRSCSSSVSVVVMAVNVLAFIFALISIFVNYSVVKWLYLEVAVLFFAVADIYDDMCRSGSATIMHIVSTLIALKVVA